MKNSDVVILAAKRSPIGKFQGALKDWSPPELVAPLIKELVSTLKTNCPAPEIQRLILGNVYSAGEGQHIVRQAARLAGLPESCATHRVERVCTASLQALWDASLFVEKYDELVIAGGMESMSRTPFLLKRGDEVGLTRDDPDPFVDSMLYDGLCDGWIKGSPHMGEIADRFAKQNHIERESQDEYAFHSYYRAYQAKSKIDAADMGILSPGYLIVHDESVVNPSLERLRQSAPMFGETITAGNSSKRSDGAAALLIASGKKTRRYGVKPLARIIAFADYSTISEFYLSAPISAVEKALATAGMKEEQIDFVEYHEPFAVSPIYFIQNCGGQFGGRDVLGKKMNVWGGAIAQGHPLGATGAIRIVTLIHALKFYQKRYGLAVACNGGGEAVAVIIENLQKR